MNEEIMNAQIEEVEYALRTDLSSSWERFRSFIDTYCNDEDLRLRSVLLGSEFFETIGNANSINLQQENNSKLIEEAISILNTIKERNKPGVGSGYLFLNKVRDFFLKKRNNAHVFVGQSITKNLGSFSIKPIDIELRMGEITSIVGANGNGKSTLLKIIAGELAINSGVLKYPEFCGENLDWVQIKRKTAYISQDLPNWDNIRSRREHLHFTAAIKGIKGKANEQAVEYILTRLGLKSYENYPWNKLSGGYRLRFELARQLVWGPQLLIMDEPLAHLDIKTQESFLSDLRNLTNSLKRPMAIVLSSQNLYEIESISDKIIFLKNGETLYNGAVKDISNLTKTNCFILNVNCETSQLRTILSRLSPNVIDINETQNDVIVKTHPTIDSKLILSTLVDANIDVRHFRNISNSTRLFFEDDQDK